MSEKVIFDGKILKGKKIIISGIQGEGKTHCAHEISKAFSGSKTAVYTTNKDDIKQYWKKRVNLIDTADFVKDFPFWCDKLLEKAKRHELDLIIIDDADALFKNHMDTCPSLRDLWANHRHYGVAIILISHRLQDIPARLYGQVEMIILFKIDSPQTIELLDKFYPNLGQMVLKIPYRQHIFIIKEIGKEPVVAYV